MEYYLISQGLECTKEIDDVDTVVKFMETCEAMNCKINNTKFLIPPKWNEEITADINKLVIPKDMTKNQRKIFVSNCLSYMRPLDYIIDGDFTFIDIYLTVSGLLCSNPIYSILGSFNISDLFLRFGRLGQWYISPSFTSLLDIYKSIISLSILKYGLISPSNKPGHLLYTYYIVKDGILESVSKEYTENGIIEDKISPMAICRLYNLVSSGGVLFNDRYPQLMKYLTLRKPELETMYREERTSHSYISPTHPASVNQKTTVPIIIEEEGPRLCISCEHQIDIKNFPKCGHNVCVSCQYLLATPACILCSSLYAPGIDPMEYIKTITRVIRHPQAKSLYEKIRQLYQSFITQNTNLFMDVSMGVYRSFITDVKLKQRSIKVTSEKYIRKTK